MKLRTGLGILLYELTPDWFEVFLMDGDHRYAILVMKDDALTFIPSDADDGRATAKAFDTAKDAIEAAADLIVQAGFGLNNQMKLYELRLTGAMVRETVEEVKAFL